MKGNAEKEVVMEAFQQLKGTMKRASKAAIEAEDFARSRGLTDIMEELVKLEGKAATLLGEAEPTEEAEAAPGADLVLEGYPRFYRRGSVLIKEGLRRGGESTYTQKMPRPAYDEVLSALRSVKGHKEKFHAPDITGRVTCPDYHVYLLLKLLQDAGYLGNPERGVYSFKKVSEDEWAGGVWDLVPTESEYDKSA